jgi:transposase-like protein
MKTTQATQTVPTTQAGSAGNVKQATTQPVKPRFSPELRERAVRLVYEQHGQKSSQWAAIESVAAKVGCSAQTLGNWIKRLEVESGAREVLPQHRNQRA